MSTAGTPRFRLSMDSLLSSTGMSSSSASSALGLEAAARQAHAVSWQQAVQVVPRALDLELEAAAGLANTAAHCNHQQYGTTSSPVWGLRANQLDADVASTLGLESAASQMHRRYMQSACIHADSSLQANSKV